MKFKRNWLSVSFKKSALLILLSVQIACSTNNDYAMDSSTTRFNEQDILKEFDLGFKGFPSQRYPKGRSQDIKYNFFFDLEHGYFATAGSRIHLYADSSRWAVVFEKNGYANRATAAEIDLAYFGNCISYYVQSYPERDYITNTKTIILISPDEYERISNREGYDMEQFELVSPYAKVVNIRSKQIAIDHDVDNYLRLGILPRDHDNPRNLISFEGLVRFIQDTAPIVLAATEEDIKEQIPKDLPMLMTIDKFHFTSVYQDKLPPSQQEIYQLIARVLVTQDTSLWKPRQQPNNHWSNWESGSL